MATKAETHGVEIQASAFQTGATGFEDAPSIDAPNESDIGLDRIDEMNSQIERRFSGQLKLAPYLNRSLVSFQANKSRSVYRWYKFKEAFSADLVEFLLTRYGIAEGKLLDPFAGSGTALFASSNRGLAADGIEVLPIGQRIIQTKKTIDRGWTDADRRALSEWSTALPWRACKNSKPIPELKITRGAYSAETKDGIEKFLAAASKENPAVAEILFFALLCVLEVISFTRKDGQYLRWDYRSERRQGARPFNKGYIPAFDEAIANKLKEIVADLSEAETASDLFREKVKAGPITLHAGSCLDVLPTLPAADYDCVFTSPPYCNRYDYTRTYALELALLGVDELRLRELRQEMLSCTVENRAKDLIALNPDWNSPVRSADRHDLFQAVLSYLAHQKKSGALNNNGIPRMVRGYFYEMAVVIYECARVLKPGAPLIMVNDNVRYAGASIPVDLILSDFASELGFKITDVLVLPNGKGNSSQQMGAHGRDRLRKCVYVWEKI